MLGCGLLGGVELTIGVRLLATGGGFIVLELDATGAPVTTAAGVSLARIPGPPAPPNAPSFDDDTVPEQAPAPQSPTTQGDS
jgi:hypothetical protein